MMLVTAIVFVFEYIIYITLDIEAG